ncbi:MAG: hypothetical protein ACRDID_20765 [Ktedonobacterales bacterium]
MTFYLEHQDEVEANFRDMDALRVANKASEEARRPEFYAEMRRRIAENRAAHVATRTDEAPESGKA